MSEKKDEPTKAIELGEGEFFNFFNSIKRLTGELKEAIRQAGGVKKFEEGLSAVDKKNIAEKIKAISEELNNFEGKSKSEEQTKFFNETKVNNEHFIRYALERGFDEVDFDPNVVEGEAVEVEDDRSEEEKFDEWKKEFKSNRKALAEKIRAVDVFSDVKVLREEFSLLRESLLEAIEDFHDKDFKNFLILLDRMEKRIDGIEDSIDKIQNKDWSNFSKKHRPELVTLYEFVRDKEKFLASPSWDPREETPRVNVALEEAITEASEIREAILRELGAVRAVDAKKEINKTYIKPAQDFLEKLEERIGLIDQNKFDKWKSDLEKISIFPKMVALKAEINRPLPEKPYGADTPENRIKILTGDGASGVIEDAKAEIMRVGFLEGKFGEKQENFVEENYFLKAEDRLEDLNLLSGEILGDKQIEAWETNIKDFRDTVEEIISISKDINIVTYRNKILDLESNLSLYYEKVSLGYFVIKNNPDDSDEEGVRIELLDPDVENKFLKKNIINLVGVDRKSGRYSLAKEKIEGLAAPIHEELSDPMNMSWEDLIREIERLNLDVYNHEVFQSSSALEYNVKIYNAFHARKGALEISDYKDDRTGIIDEEKFLKEEQERIDSVYWIVLSKVESLNQNEGQVPTCTRPDLFPELIKRQVDRNYLLKATTYHPEHGNLMRKMLDDVIVAVAQREPKTEIHYTTICGSGKGRAQVAKYMKDNFYDLAMNSLYQDLSLEERRKKVDRFFALSNVVYNLFDLLTISFAELQKNTQTGAHQKTKGGVYLKMDNYVAITRPDAAAVHATQRYASPSHPLAQFSTLLKPWPRDFGKLDVVPGGEGTYHDKLIHQQEELLDFQNAIYEISAITGENGIEPTSLFDPLFPDTRSFLYLSDRFHGGTEMLEFGNDVWGLNENGEYVNLGRKGEEIILFGEKVTLKENFAITGWYENTAMIGWKKIMQLTFGILPGEITSDMILHHSDTGGDDADLGFIDVFLNSGCGMAKMYPGRHMEAVTQMFTFYIMRIFQRYRANPRYRDHTFQKVIEKIQNATTPKSGLGGYRDVAAQVIRNISDSKYSSWSDDKILDTPADEFKMGEVLQDGVAKRRKERIEWILKHYEHEGLIPPNTSISFVGEWWVSIASFFDKFSQIDQAEFWQMVDGELPLPEPEINRKKGLFESVDKEKH